MDKISGLLVLIVSLMHFWFMALEMIFWDKPLGLKTFRMTPEKARVTKQLAINQGLYNGFLAFGLLWSLCTHQIPNQIFFLSCVVVAGVVGALTVSKKILYVQASPAILALISILFLG